MTYILFSLVFTYFIKVLQILWLDDEVKLASQRRRFCFFCHGMKTSVSAIRVRPLNGSRGFYYWQ